MHFMNPRKEIYFSLALFNSKEQVKQGKNTINIKYKYKT